MGRADYAKFGDWNANCDICGQKYKASQLRLRWDGYMCCPKDWEPRQPQDFVRGVRDDQSVPWSRPAASPTFVPNTWTPTLPEDESATLYDAIAKQIVKRFSSLAITQNSGGVNQAAINGAVLNASSMTIPGDSSLVLNLADAYASTLSKPFTEAFSLSQAYANAVTKPFTEALAMTDGIALSVAVFPKPLDAFAVNAYSVN